MEGKDARDAGTKRKTSSGTLSDPESPSFSMASGCAEPESVVGHAAMSEQGGVPNSQQQFLGEDVARLSAEEAKAIAQPVLQVWMTCCIGCLLAILYLTSLFRCIEFLSGVQVAQTEQLKG